MSGSILTNQDSAFWTNQIARICSPPLHEDRSTRYQGRGLLSIKAGASLSQEAYFPFPRQLRTAFLLKEADLHGAEWTTPELPNWRGAWPQGCDMAMLFSQSCCITIELFALNKVSFFTAPQTGDSCRLWGGTCDHWLTQVTYELGTWVQLGHSCWRGSIWKPSRSAQRQQCYGWLVSLHDAF